MKHLMVWTEIFFMVITLPVDNNVEDLIHGNLQTILMNYLTKNTVYRQFYILKLKQNWCDVTKKYQISNANTNVIKTILLLGIYD